MPLRTKGIRDADRHLAGSFFDCPPPPGTVAPDLFTAKKRAKTSKNNAENVSSGLTGQTWSC
jgi:hypothetical protein